MQKIVILFYCLLISVTSLFCSTTSWGDFLEMSDGIKIYYDISGSGYPLLLIHGGDCYGTYTGTDSDFKASKSWNSQIQDFSKKYRTIRLDIRGFGLSDKLPGHPQNHPLNTLSWKESEDRTVTDAIELLNFLGIQKAHVVGLSIGSGIAAQLAVFHPEIVDKLVLVSVWFGHSLSFQTQQQADKLKELYARTLMIAGTEDVYTRKELSNAESVYTYISDTVLFRDSGHFLNSESPEKFNKTVLEFLTGDRIIWDADCNGKWSLPDIIYGLQTLVGIRQPDN